MKKIRGKKETFGNSSIGNSSIKKTAGKSADTFFDTSGLERLQAFLDSETPAAHATQFALAAVALSLVIVASPAAQGIGITLRAYDKWKRYEANELNNAVYNIKKRGYVSTHVGTDGKPRVILTKKGEEYLKKILFDDTKLPTPDAWNGRWTFVIFDIPVTHARARDAFRWRLKKLGFYQYQKSVWVYPFPCTKEVLFMADYFEIGKFVEVLETDTLSDDKKMKDYFKLK